MSHSELERFARDLRTDAALLAEVRKDDCLEAIVGVAGRHGYSFTLDEATAVSTRAAGKQLSDGDLAAASGGSLESAMSAAKGGKLSEDPFTPPPISRRGTSP
ncbi:hypothetical protein BH11PSE3_BH11PSE3_22010 [soil metagenome]